MLRDGIVSTASSLGIDPVDLATAISYETAGTFDPTKAGPTTQWGQHRGLIQFGEPQAQKYGVDWNDPVGSQLGPNGAVANYLRDTGVKPGMGLLDIYSAINAGGVGRYGASDANNGGAPGTVADKVNQQMAGHRQKAMELIGGGGNATMAGGEGQDTMQNTMTPFISTQGQAPEEPKRWLDPDRRDRLILALEGMTLNPNKGLMMAAAGGLEERREGRKEGEAQAQRAEQRNRTAQWLAQQGRDDLAQAVAGGMIDGKSAVQEAMKPAADDRTAMEKNYNFLLEQGIPEDQALQMARGGQTINVNNGDAPAQDGPLREQLLKKQGESWSAVVEAGTKAARATPDLEALRELAKVAPSGPMTGRLAEMFPEYNDVSAAREAIIKRVAPTLRVEGSGSTSDVEYAGMVQGMGRLTNRPEANVAIADMMIAKAELDRQRADTVRAYQTGDATYADTVSKLSELDRVSIMPDSLKSLLTAQQGQGSGGDDLSAEERKYLGLD